MALNLNRCAILMACVVLIATLASAALRSPSSSSTSTSSSTSISPLHTSNEEILSSSADRLEENDPCRSYIGCAACVRGRDCGFCFDSDSVGCSTSRGSCIQWTTETNQCPRIRCEDLARCSDCLSSEFNCKFCPGGVGCVSAEATTPCENGFLESESDSGECPERDGEAAAGTIAPITCIIVLFSFIIAIL